MAHEINARFITEANIHLTNAWRIIDSYKGVTVGDLYRDDHGIFWFALADGRSRFGGYAPVMNSLRRMLRINTTRAIAA